MRAEGRRSRRKTRAEGGGSRPGAVPGRRTRRRRDFLCFATAEARVAGRSEGRTRPSPGLALRTRAAPLRRLRVPDADLRAGTGHELAFVGNTAAPGRRAPLLGLRRRRASHFRVASVPGDQIPEGVHAGVPRSARGMDALARVPGARAPPGRDLRGSYPRQSDARAGRARWFGASREALGTAGSRDGEGRRPRVRRGGVLPGADRRLVARRKTFFVASIGKHGATKS